MEMQSYPVHGSSLSLASGLGSSPPAASPPPLLAYNLAIIGCTVSSNCFFCALNSSTSASLFESNHLIASSIAFSIVDLSSSFSFPPNFSLSPIWFFNEYAYDSNSFLASTRSLIFLSSSENFSASLIIRSISSVPLSSAVTLRIPFTSISNVTSICGTPRGAGGIPVKSNLPNKWLSLVIGRSPSYTWIVTAVEKICDFLVGITVFLGINLVMTPPTVSIPMVKGLTSNNTNSPVFSSPDNTPAWTAAP
ncbi:hypothetical protein DERF_010643 [Dermatophagoides farinae]|uniref:Uncharacterized protein n=1 Tax=Dermatophagoides farinae TaxID=6954 RepID=A0A922HTD3_DERFA|nr:hypothetical protein DERF_010643 [Dermatophagoides farinae]